MELLIHMLAEKLFSLNPNSYSIGVINALSFLTLIGTCVISPLVFFLSLSLQTLPYCKIYYLQAVKFY